MYHLETGKLSLMPPQFVADAVIKNSGDRNSKNKDILIEHPLFCKKAFLLHTRLSPGMYKLTTAGNSSATNRNIIR